MERLRQNQMFTAPLISRREIAPEILEITILKPDDFAFIPGQFIRFHHDGTPRDYTILSHKNSDVIEFCIALVDGGHFSNFITTSPIGHQIQFSGPHGHFVFRESSRSSIFVATGTGVAPFVAFCRDGITCSILLQGASNSDELIYKDALESCSEKYVPCVTNTEPVLDSINEPYVGRVTDYLETMLISDVYDFYVCGQRSMIADVTKLIDDMYSSSRLFIENFY